MSDEPQSAWKQHLKIYSFGDSFLHWYSQFLLGPDEQLHDPKAKSSNVVFSGWLEFKIYSPTIVFHYGLRGGTLAKVECIDIKSIAPDIVGCFLGSNDLCSLSGQQLFKKLSEFITKTLSMFPSIKVFLVFAPYPRDLNPKKISLFKTPDDYAERLSTFNRLMQTFSLNPESKTIYWISKEMPFSVENNKLSRDGVHLLKYTQFHKSVTTAYHKAVAITNNV